MSWLDSFESFSSILYPPQNLIGIIIYLESAQKFVVYRYFRYQVYQNIGFCDIRFWATIHITKRIKCSYSVGGLGGCTAEAIRRGRF